MKSVGDRVRERRERLGIARKVLAREVGMSYSGLSDLESGKAKSTTKLHLLARALGVAVDWLAAGDEPGYGGVAESAPPYGQPSLSPDEKAILDLWRGLDADGRKALQTVGHALEKPRLTRRNTERR